MLKYLRTHCIVTISVAQLFGTSLWFSANSAAFDLMHEWNINISDIGLLTNAVQTGFILGTLLIALLGIADRYKASLIFSYSALLGGIFNLCFAWLASNISEALIFRFFVGVSLAGIYPIGMKLMIEWAPEKSGQALSVLVAMLTLGTALPYAFNAISTDLPWRYIISTSTFLAFFACILIFFLGDKPRVQRERKLKKTSTFVHFSAFKNPRFKAAAIGYFGHMWELYTFWTLVPLLIVQTQINEHFKNFNLSILVFTVISVGALGCILGGMLTQYVHNKTIALSALALSGFCCFMYALGWEILPAWALFTILIVWGISVVADSPQFSALSAQACLPEQLGSALALQNSIGFFLTIMSIGVSTYTFDHIGVNAIWIMLIGPIIGIIGYLRFDQKT
jgi:MFS family permease